MAIHGIWVGPQYSQTGLTNRYNLYADFSKAIQFTSNPKVLNKIVREQLGLELVPSRESIEMLVVERARN